jgi:hypothetical protein
MDRLLVRMILYMAQFLVRMMCRMLSGEDDMLNDFRRE